jgi:hypothetical protein
MSSQTETPPVAIPLPRFRRPISDPPLPEVDSPTATDGPSPDQPQTGPSSPQDPTSLDASPPPPPVLSPGPRTLTGTSSRAGDPKVAGEVLAGLIALACLWAYTIAGRSRRHFRQPTQDQIDDVATPLGNIAARHLPTEFINRDLVDASRAVGAAHRYVIDGPLLTRYDEPLPEVPE